MEKAGSVGKEKISVAEAGRRGGIAHAALVRAGLIPVTGAAEPKETVCRKGCQTVYPTATAARNCKCLQVRKAEAKRRKKG
jgi:hypothetical protein